MPAATPIDTLKQYFETGDTPTQEQFYAWLYSFRHLSTAITINDLDQDLQDALQHAAGVTNDFKISFYSAANQLPATGSNKVLYVVLSSSALYVWNGAAYQQVGGGSPKFSGNIPVLLAGGKTLGKYGSGSTINFSEKTLVEIITDLVTEVTPPTYNGPSASVSLNQNSDNIEVGQSVEVAVNLNYNQNDAGGVTAVVIRKNGNAIAGNSEVIVSMGANPLTYDAIVNYAQGPVKNDTAGNPYPVGQIPAGTITAASALLRGYYKVFFGPAAADPANSAAVRALPRSRFENAGNTFLLDTGNTERIFAVAFPAYKSIASIIDLDALNANVTSSYVVSTFNVNDAAGNPVAYKVAVMTNAGPYPTPHFHQITFI